MSIELQQFQESEGYTDEQMADILSERLKRPISVTGYKMFKNRKNAPALWLEALAIVPHDPSHVERPATESGADEAPRDPMQPSNIPDYPENKPRKITPDSMLPFEPQTAFSTIAMIYTFAGKGAGAVMGSDAVAETWRNFAPHIAQAYIEWAKENETVARIIATMTLGGAGGKVVLLHAELMVTTLIVSGQMPASMIVPPNLRPEEQEETSVTDADYPGGDENGNEPRKQRARKGRASATE